MVLRDSLLRLARMVGLALVVILVPVLMIPPAAELLRVVLEGPSMGACSPLRANVGLLPAWPLTYEGFAAGRATDTRTDHDGLWHNDDAWWAIMAADRNGRPLIHELTRNSAWQPTAADVGARSGDRSSALWDGSKLHVVAQSAGQPLEVRRFSYQREAREYSLDAGFPISIDGSADSSPVALAKDGFGRLWVAFIRGGQVHVANSAPDRQSWAASFVPLVVEGDVAHEDGVGLVAFAGGLGVMWSSQSIGAVRFAIHDDTATPGAGWSVETALAGAVVAERHVDIKSDSSGRVYGSLVRAPGPDATAGSPRAVLLVRDAHGRWSEHAIGTSADGHSQPVLAVDEHNQLLHVLAARGGAIMYKASPLATISLVAGPGAPFLKWPDAAMGRATVPRQAVDAQSDLLVLAGAADRRYYHAVLGLGRARDVQARGDERGGSVGFRGGSAGSSTSAELTITRPAGVMAGDVLLASIDTAGPAAVAPPAGWELVRTDRSADTVTKSTFVHVARTSEPASYTWHLPPAQASAGVVLAYSGVDPEDPIEAVVGRGNDGGQPLVAPAAAVAGAGARLVGLFGLAVPTTIGLPTALIPRAEAATDGAGADVTSAAGDVTCTGAGTTGEMTAVAPHSGSSVGQLVLLRPRATAFRPTEQLITPTDQPTTPTDAPTTPTDAPTTPTDAPTTPIRLPTPRPPDVTPPPDEEPTPAPEPTFTTTPTGGSPPPDVSPPPDLSPPPDVSPLPTPVATPTPTPRASPLPVEPTVLPPCELSQRSQIPGTSATLNELRCDLDENGSLVDRLTILRPSDQDDAQLGWPAVADTENAWWIFDAGSNGVIDLVIHYYSDARGLVADMYDSQDSPRRLHHTITGANFAFTRDIPPTVQVIAADGWWQRGRFVNFNLEILVDGLLDAAFDMRAKLRGHVETDGIIDFTIRIVDETGTGRPDYDWRTVRHPETQPRALQLTFLTVNECGNEPPLAPTWPWPYFGRETYGYLTANRHEVSEPPIQMSWETGTLMAVGEFVSSRGNDCQWFIYSNEELQPDLPNRANFENPFAWYDLAGDQDGQPELAVRQVYFDANDPLFVRGNFESPINVIRYSWDQTNDDLWDYKLGLLGNYPITSTVRVGDAEIATIPYDEFPRYVVDRPWHVATFVSADGVRARGEGIYTWDPSAWLTERYYTGFSDSPWPPDGEAAERDVDQLDLNHIPVGYRGEYQLDMNDRIRLYISPIDQKLHMFKAAVGSWRIDERSEMQYADRDGDGYLDEWRHYVDGELYQQLNVSGPYLIYSGPEGVIIRNAPRSSTVWEATPPADPTEWAELGAALAPFEPDLSLPPAERERLQTDLRVMLDRFDGPTVEIARAATDAFRPDADGFRFVLGLERGYRAVGDNLLALPVAAPGRYLVTYGSPLQVRQLTPPRVVLQADAPRSGVPTAGLPVPLRVRVSNTGLEDATDLLLIGTATRGGESIEFVRRNLDALSGQGQQLDVTWHPRSAGEWAIGLRVEDADEEVLASQNRRITVRAGESTAFTAVALDSSGDGLRLPSYLLLVATALLIGWAVQRAGWLSGPPSARARREAGR